MEDKYLKSPFGESSSDESQDAASSRGKEPEDKGVESVASGKGKEASSSKPVEQQPYPSHHEDDAGEGADDFFSTTFRGTASPTLGLGESNPITTTTTTTTTTTSSSQPPSLAKKVTANPASGAWQKASLAKPTSALSGSLNARTGATLGSSRSSTPGTTPTSNDPKSGITGLAKSTGSSIDKEAAALNRWNTVKNRDAAKKTYAEVWPRFFDGFNNQAKLLLLKDKLDQLEAGAHPAALSEQDFTPVLDEYVVVCELNRIKALRTLAIDPKWTAALVQKLTKALLDCRLAIESAAKVRAQEYLRIGPKPTNMWNPAKVEEKYESAAFKARSLLTDLIHGEAAIQFWPDCIQQCEMSGEAEIGRVVNHSTPALSAPFFQDPTHIVVMHWCQLYMASERVEWDTIFQMSFSWDFAQWSPEVRANYMKVAIESACTYIPHKELSPKVRYILGMLIAKVQAGLDKAKREKRCSATDSQCAAFMQTVKLNLACAIFLNASLVAETISEEKDEGRRKFMIELLNHVFMVVRRATQPVFDATTAFANDLGDDTSERMVGHARKVRDYFIQEADESVAGYLKPKTDT
ncbi:hypothetical protein VARIO8X_160005 [Burkholderiales bacterium 8X]|nr:hypothetical protein VARIO8X_160005 [Burkholderiales bacterium 8X]